MRPRWQEHLLWKPERRVLGRPAWVVLLLCVLGSFVAWFIDGAALTVVPEPDGYRAGQMRPMMPVNWWTGTMTSTLSMGANSCVTVAAYLPPVRGSLGFTKPFATLSLSVAVTTPAGTRTAPLGTSQSEVVARAGAEGLVVMGNLVTLPGRAGEEFFGLKAGEHPAIGTHRRIVWAAAVFDGVHAALLCIPVLGVLALLRMVFTARSERRSLRVGLGLCPRCRYDRSGLGAGAACPECGEAATRGLPLTDRYPTR